MTPTMICSRRARAAGLDDAGGIELGERLVPVAAGLVAGVVAGAGALEDRDDLGDLGRARVAARVELAARRARSSGPACSAA